MTRVDNYDIMPLVWSSGVFQIRTWDPFVLLCKTQLWGHSLPYTLLAVYEHPHKTQSPFPIEEDKKQVVSLSGSIVLHNYIIIPKRGKLASFKFYCCQSLLSTMKGYARYQAHDPGESAFHIKGKWMGMTSIYLQRKLVQVSTRYPLTMNVKGHFCYLVTKPDGSRGVCVTEVPYCHPKGCQVFCIFGFGADLGTLTCHLLQTAGDTFSCPDLSRCCSELRLRFISLDSTLGSFRIKGLLLQKLENCQQKGWNIAPCPCCTEQGIFSCSVGLGLNPARSCLSANTIRFKSMNNRPRNHWKLFC